ncbi:MAG: diguanylate cyclase [Anaerolineae bacterium]
MRILIADDDVIVRRLIQAMLAHAGHEVLVAEDGQAAWELLQHESVRFVITDWMMPNLGGPSLVRRIRSAGAPTYTYVILLTAKDGKEDVVAGLQAGADDYLTKPFDPSELHARIAIGERILDLETRLREARDQMEVLATHDSLTGLLNRRALYEHIEAEMNRAEREVEPMSVVLLDIDYFKVVNDQHGHLIGDQALCRVADTIVHNKRPYDWAGRWGGEEFLLVLPGATLAEASDIAERVRAAVAAAALPLPDGRRLHVQVSLGVTSMAPTEPQPLDTLLQQADEALYRAKRQGRNQVCCYAKP